MSQNKVTKEQIDAIMDDVAYHVYRVPDTTTTIAVAFDKDMFSLAVGMSACVDPANFDEEKGAEYACKDATAKAREKLWELEGYLLAKSAK